MQKRQDEEDKEMFDKIMNDSERHDKKIQTDLKAKMREKNKLDKFMDNLNSQLFVIDA